jgi:hypothetical protein
VTASTNSNSGWLSSTKRAATKPSSSSSAPSATSRDKSPLSRPSNS